MNQNRMDAENYIELIGKKLSGDISIDENDQLLTWLDENESNRELFLEYEKAWEVSAEGAPIPDVDLDLEFAKIDLSEDTKVIDINEPPRAKNRYLWSIAASLIVVLGIGAYYTFVSANTQIIHYTADAIKRVSLPDGSIAVLGENSEISYDEDFVSNRDVDLKGEAFFDVVKSDKEFRVKTKYERIRVFGTSFNVNAGEKQTQVTVKSGEVEVENNDGVKQKVRAHEVLLANHEDGSLSTSEVSDFSSLAWSLESKRFEDAKLPEVLSEVETRYGVSIQYPDTMKEEVISVTLEQQSIDQVLDELALTKGLSYQEDSLTSGSFIFYQ